MPGKPSTECLNDNHRFCSDAFCNCQCHPGNQTEAQPDLFGGEGQARESDPQTSHAAAKFIKAKATTARVMLMRAHEANPNGLSDEQAAYVATLSLRSEYATRCSELLRMGFLADTGRTVESEETGLQRRVLQITPAGQRALNERQDR